MTEVSRLLAIDSLMHEYLNKFISMISTIIDRMCTPKNGIIFVDNINNSNGVTNVHASKPLSKLYRKHCTELSSLINNSANGMPLSTDGSMTTRYLGGTCSICSMRTRVDVEHVPGCPNIGKAGHIIGCPICFNDPSHDILTCPYVCYVMSRSVPKQYKLDNYVEYYKANPLVIKGSSARKPMKQRKPKKQPVKKEP